MRSALGARWARLFRQVLTESVTLALIGGVLGGVLAGALVALFKAIGGHAVPRADAVTVGWPVFAAGLLAALLAAMVAGLLPALRAALPDRFRALDAGRTTTGRGERRLLGAVAVLQIVLTVALLAGAVLHDPHGAESGEGPPGIRHGQHARLTVTAVQSDTWKDFHTRALERVAALPGVTHAAFVWGLPLTGNKWSGRHGDHRAGGLAAGSPNS